MVKHIKNSKRFCGITDEEAKVNLSTGKPLVVVNNCAE